ncbi:MAG TPA: hypothetical protein PKI32_07375, partial [Opitutales bacterium]|nr:hypothetical protein [Opitutales bacterium]
MNDETNTPSESALLHLSAAGGVGDEAGVPDEFQTDDRNETGAAPLPELNDAEAGNIAFIISDRISRS